MEKNIDKVVTITRGANSCEDKALIINDMLVALESRIQGILGCHREETPSYESTKETASSLPNAVFGTETSLVTTIKQIEEINTLLNEIG